MPWAIIRGTEKLFRFGKFALDVPGRKLSNWRNSLRHFGSNADVLTEEPFTNRNRGSVVSVLAIAPLDLSIASGATSAF